MNKEFLNSQVVKHAESIIETKKTDLLFKLIFDKVIAIILLLVLSPVFLVLAFLIKKEDNGPVFYRQERITKYGKVFKIYKFRTMVNNADKLGSLVTTKNDQRITKIGSFIRKYRLDEIPQLLNILEGNMSFVGARPEVMRYVAQYTDEMKITLLLPAGVTSMSSIDFKDEEVLLAKYTAEGMTLDEAYIEKILPIKMQKNIEYIYKFNFIEDIKIMILTVIHVIK